MRIWKVEDQMDGQVWFRLQGTNEELDQAVRWVKVHAPSRHTQGFRIRRLMDDGSTLTMGFQDLRTAMTFRLTFS